MNITKVSNQAELDEALKSKAKHIDILGEWENVVIPEGAEIISVDISGTVTGSVDIYGTVTGSVYISGTVTGSVYISGTVTGSVYIYGTVTGSVYISGTVTGSVYIYGTAKVGSVYIYGTAKVGSVDIYGTVTGSVYISGTVTGSVYIYGTAKVGSVYIYGTVTGSVYIYGTVTGSVYIYGTVTGSVYISGTVTGSVDIYGTVTGSVYISGTVEDGQAEKKYFGATLKAIEADHAAVLALAIPEEIVFLRAALVGGTINGHLYEGPCACLVGTLKKAQGRGVFPQDQNRLAEKWYMPITKGHTPENSTHARLAVEWIDRFTAAAVAAPLANG